MRKQPMQWLNSLKLAVINKDINSIHKHISDIPEITDMANAQEALALIKESINIVEKEKENALEQINKIKQTKAFLNNH